MADMLMTGNLVCPIIEIFERLVSFGVDYIEVGFGMSSPF